MAGWEQVATCLTYTPSQPYSSHHCFDMMEPGTGTYNAKVFMKAETYKGSEMTAGDWTLIHSE
jgi:hypothetical protein